MRPVHLLSILRVAALVAWATSVALCIDYLSVVPSFCSGASGCGAIRQSGLGYFEIPGLGVIPLLPLLGAAAFSLVFWLTLLPSAALRRRWAGSLAFSVAPVGLLLLIAQQQLGAFCSLCVTVDTSALIVGACAWLLRKEGWEAATVEENAPKAGRHFALQRFTWGFYGFLAIVVPVLYPAVVAISPTPGVVSSLYQPGKINVVEFFDFGCPHCRALAPRLEAMLAPYGDRVHFVRRHVPLDFHLGAREASRVALCAEEQGKGEAVALAFLGAPAFEAASELQPTEFVSKLTLELERLALDHGASAEPLKSCLASKRPDLRLAEDRARIEQAGFEGLPTTYIGAQRLLGAGPDELYLDALRKVESGRDVQGLLPSVYWGIVVVVLGLLGFFGRKRPAQS